MPERSVVMICDDEPDILKLFGSALQSKYEVLVADSGKKCIETYLQVRQSGRHVDVLLLDYKLGDMLGDVVACKLSQLNGIKTIMITAYDLENSVIQDLLDKKCIIDTMKKPVRLPVMLQRIEQILGPRM